jgi:hypothetical protein
MLRRLIFILLPVVACGGDQVVAQNETPDTAESSDELGANNIGFYHSDNCSSDLIALAGNQTNCDQVGQRITTSVWGVKVGNKCIDIADQSFTPACKAFQQAGDPGATVLYHSDNCSSGALAYVNEKTDCRNIGITASVWGISQNNQCQDISDAAFVDACLAFQQTTPQGGGNIAIYHSDNCSGSLIANVGEKTNCDSLTASSSAWGVKANGVCYDIVDTTVSSACRAFKAANDPHATSLYKADNCSTALVAFVNQDTECEKVGVTSSVWGIKTDNECSDITDLSFVDACERFKGAGGSSDPQASSVSLYHSDNCNAGLLVTLDDRTNCDQLAGTGSVWGFSTNGQCVDVPDRTAVDACYTLSRAGSRSAVSFWHADNCQGPQALAYADEQSDCTTIAAHVHNSVWAVVQNGRCLDIQDTDFATACKTYLQNANPHPMPKH